MNATKEANIPAAQKPQTYVVDDATDENNIDAELAQFSAPSIINTINIPKPPSEKISKALEDLIFIGRLTEEIEIDEAKFEISTMTNKEHNQVIKQMYKFSEASDLFTMRSLTLANALRKINSVALEDIDIGKEFETAYLKRLAIVEHLQLSVVEKLYEAYEKLVGVEDETNKETEELKNS